MLGKLVPLSSSTLLGLSVMLACAFSECSWGGEQMHVNSCVLTNSPDIKLVKLEEGEDLRIFLNRFIGNKVNLNNGLTIIFSFVGSSEYPYIMSIELSDGGPSKYLHVMVVKNDSTIYLRPIMAFNNSGIISSNQNIIYSRENGDKLVSLFRENKNSYLKSVDSASK